MMKKLTTPSGVFGPFDQVQTLGDRYRCDGADLPFSVVGEGTIDDWTGDLPVFSSLPDVPVEVTRRQFKLALLSISLLDDVEAIVAGSNDRALQINYAEALVFERNNPLVLSMAAALGKTSAEIDALFIYAAGL